MNISPDCSFDDAIRGLRAGDFSRLAPLFEARPASHADFPAAKWIEGGDFAAEPEALEEAFACACFNGAVPAVQFFLARGINPDSGNGTGLNAIHWAANRGQLEVVEILIQNKASLETRNAHGSTVLGCTVWSAIHEPKTAHLKIIEMLLKAGAKIEEAGFPTGHERVDELLRCFGAR